MNFRIADTFSSSLGKLTAQEQKATKTTAFDLQMDPANPGIQMHRVDRSSDKNFWSGRVNQDVRIILHRTGDNLMLCYVGHHDAAYAWAERRKIERHPKTGAAQLVQVRETVVEIPTYVPSATQGEAHEAAPQLEEAAAAELGESLVTVPPPLEGHSDDLLLGFGVPPEWLDEVQGADEDTLLEIAELLPGEAAEAVLALAVGEVPQVRPEIFSEGADAFEHPDAQRRFRRIEDEEELARALEFPLERWAVYLHPQQRSVVEKQYNGSARVAGSAGTGKTVVALHRAVHLARLHGSARVLLTTFSAELARQLQRNLRVLVREEREPRLAERIRVEAMSDFAKRLYRARGLGEANLASPDWIRREIAEAMGAVAHPRFTEAFLRSEWEHVVDAWQLRTSEEFQSVPRLGRKRRLSQGQREELWQVFGRLLTRLDEEGLQTEARMFSLLSEHFAEDKNKPFQFIVIDESQDLSVSQLRFLGKVSDDDPEALFFAGDLGQRIFRQPFSWLELGIDIRGRSRTLRLNYRTSHQIRETIDRLLHVTIQDVDGVAEERKGTVSAFNGPVPEVKTFSDADDEWTAVAGWLHEQVNTGLLVGEIALFVRTEEQFPRAEAALREAGLNWVELVASAPETGKVALGTMHDAKGLEFKAVAVMACDDDVVPLASRLVTAGETSDLEEINNTERHLLYVAASRARERLWLSGVEPESEFFADMTH